MTHSGRKRLLQGGGLVLLGLLLAGCATARTPSPVAPPPARKAAVSTGVYHKVSKGETLWRIAKAYQISVDDLIQSNHIPNAASIEENQLILIPGAAALRPVPPAAASVGKDIDYLWPLKGRVVSYFQDHKGASVNTGIDIKGGEGVPVLASRSGRVVFADHLAGYGSTVILDHADGFFTVYGRNDHLLVNLGDSVAQGDKIALTGGNETASVLHFELRKGERAQNPLYYLPRDM